MILTTKWSRFFELLFKYLISERFYNLSEENAANLSYDAYEKDIAMVQVSIYFTNILRAAFTSADPKKRKKYREALSLFCAFGICARKSFA